MKLRYSTKHIQYTDSTPSISSDEGDSLDRAAFGRCMGGTLYSDQLGLLGIEVRGKPERGSRGRGGRCRTLLRLYRHESH
jgi:hypothetical protein